MENQYVDILISFFFVLIFLFLNCIDMSQTTTFHIPVVFDVSGGATLFAEEKPDDFVENHLQFTLDARTNAYGYTLTAADISNSIYIADRDSGDALFYQSAEEGRTLLDLSRKISQSIIHGNLKNDISDLEKRVPIGGGSVTAGEATLYSGGLTDTAGNHLPECLARVISTHLVGHPLAQAFIKDETALYQDISDNQENQMVAQLNKILGNDEDSEHNFPNLTKVSDADRYHAVDSSGASNVVLKSLFEQLMAVTGRSNAAREVIGREYADLDEDGFNILEDRTELRGFPFLDGDKVVFYIRVKAHLSFEESMINSVFDSSGDTLLEGFGTITSGDLSGVDTSGAIAATIATVFPGGQDNGLALENKYGWMGASTNATESLNQQCTNETDPTVLDAHIWKVTVTI